MQSLPSSDIGAKGIQVSEMQSAGNPAEGGRRLLRPGVRSVRTSACYAPCTGLTLYDWRNGVVLADLQRAISALTVDTGVDGATFDDDAVESLKFHECLPPSLRQEVLRKRFVNRTTLAAVISKPTHIVFVGEND